MHYHRTRRTRVYPHWAQEEEEEPGPDRDRRSINTNDVEHLRTKRGGGEKGGHVRPGRMEIREGKVT